MPDSDFHLPPDLLARYDALRAAARPLLAQGRAELDGLLLSPLDTRRGLTLLTRPPAPITAAIEAILADFRAVEPAQYYYPASDIHLTILSIISCVPGFTLAAVDAEAYSRAIRAILAPVRPFTITYAGLTASAGGILVQGFPQGPGLADLRAALRRYLPQTGLPQSIDQRYRLQTAHSTVIRFGQPLAHPAALLARLAHYERQFIGTFEVNALELVFNDWYQRAANTVLLEKYSLGPAAGPTFT